MTPLYTAVATATGGREGKTRSDDGIIDLPLFVPKSMGGPGGAGTNPEQLFAAGYAEAAAPRPNSASLRISGRVATTASTFSGP